MTETAGAWLEELSRREHRYRTEVAKGGASSISLALPSVRRWERDCQDEATPRCPECAQHLGIRRAMFTATGRDVWLCDHCDREIDP
jgi:hypothetical protein